MNSSHDDVKSVQNRQYFLSFFYSYDCEMLGKYQREDFPESTSLYSLSPSLAKVIVPI